MKTRRSLPCHAASLLTLFFTLLTSAQAVQIPMKDAIGGWTNGGSNFVVGTTGTDFDTNAWPSGESPSKVIDGDTSSSSKFLIFKDGNVGVIVSPQVGWTGLPVNRMVAWSANDAEGRDPANFILYGSTTALTNSNVGQIYATSSMTPITNGGFSLPSARNSAGPSITFLSNTTAYASYLLIFTSTKPDIYDVVQDPGRTQVAEVQFFHEPPEIRVTGGLVTGPEIVDGDTTPSTGDNTDLGSRLISAGAVTREITVQNTGTGRLTLQSVQISGSHAADFYITNPLPLFLDPGTSTFFYINFDPSAAGLRTATISFGNNDSDENPYNFNIQGTGILSNDNNLTDLTLSTGILSPTFNSSTTSYTATVPNATSSITVTPTRSNASASIHVRVNGGGYTSVNSGSASGSLALNIGSNTVDVRVTAEDASTKTYTVTVTRTSLAPTVTSVSPSSGPIAGGTTVTLTGANFTGATGVTFTGVPATSVSVVSATSITCVTPARPLGAASVVVTTSQGNNSANSLFTYVNNPINAT